MSYLADKEENKEEFKKIEAASSVSSASCSNFVLISYLHLSIILNNSSASFFYTS